MTGDYQAVLSDRDIERELGENILIFPFSKANLKGASYNLTVSRLAWDLETKTSIFDASKNEITIKSKSSALIETNEAIWVSSKIAGTYHSKVKLVAQGLSHLGTTLDPLYLGSSLITIHNHSSQPVILIPERDTFATLMFYYVNTEASTTQRDNSPGRLDALQGYVVTQEEKAWLDEPFRNEVEGLRDKMLESSDYKNILTRKQAEENKQQDKKRELDVQKLKKRTTFVFISASFLITVLSVSGVLYLNANEKDLREKNPNLYYWASTIASTLAVLVPGSAGVAFLTKVYSDWK